MNTEEFFSKVLIIENDLVLLRPLKKSDIDEVETISFSQELGEFGARVKTKTDLEGYFDYCLSAKSNKELYPFIILNKADEKPIGITMFGNIDFHHRRLEIGWTWIAEKHQGTGLNGICKTLLLDYCFNQLRLRRVEFRIDLKNIKSQKAIEKLGAIKEGMLRNYNIQSYGKSEGTYVYSILTEEWNKNSV